MKQENFILILSSPSGAGKTSLSREILKTDPGLTPSISTTTRPKRTLEVEGKDYFFVSKPIFKQMHKEKKFIETAKVFENYYGSPLDYLYNQLDNGFDVLYDINWQGARSLKRKLGKLAVSIFILPPSMEELERRLKKRNQDDEEEIQRRLDTAHFEISKYVLYDYVIINNEFNDSLQKIQTIITAERLKRTDYSNFVTNL